MKIKRNNLSPKTLQTLRKLERTQRLAGSDGKPTGPRSKIWGGKPTAKEERKKANQGNDFLDGYFEQHWN